MSSPVTCPPSWERILALGATVIREVKEAGIHFYTLADLEGNNFDLAAE